MRNPWMKKNPFTSMWLSGANAALGSARGRTTAQAKRQATTMMSEAAKQLVRFWNGASIERAASEERKSR